jgi:hypothetical protein
MKSKHLSEAGIVQAFDKGVLSADQFRIAMIHWLCEATNTQLDILCAELLDGFANSSD